MKLYIVFAVAIVVFTNATEVFSQVPQVAAKVAVIDTDAFSDPKNGITRLTAALGKIEANLKKDSDALTALRSQIETLAKDLQTNGNKYDAKTMSDKTRQGESLQRKFTFDQETLRINYEKEIKTQTDPIYTELKASLQSFARQRGIDLIIDAGKVAGAFLVVNNSIDITPAFIKEFNAKAAGVPVKP